MYVTCFGFYLVHSQACQYKKLEIVSLSTYLRMDQVQAEACSIYVTVIKLIKINLCFIGLNKCGLFSNKHKEMASV